MSAMISSDNVEQLAKNCYENTILDESEFWEDYDRIKYIKRLFNRFRDSGTIKTNLVVNHLIVLFNVFEPKELTRILFYKFEGYHEYLKPFLELLQRCPDQVAPYTLENTVLFVNTINDDEGIVDQLRRKVLANE